MANYTAADIKEIRESTGAGMLDVKKALDEAEGDKAKAVELIRVKGLKGIAKREGRSASEGLVAFVIRDLDDQQEGTLLELNSETDFVAKNAKFIALGDEAVAAGLQARHERSAGAEKNVSAVDAEPLAEWEQELLKQSEVQQEQAAAEATEAPAAAETAAEAPAVEETEAPAAEATASDEAQA